MRQGARASYSWGTDTGVVNYVTHDDTANSPAGTYHSYGKRTCEDSDEGVIVEAINGLHGLFWRNRRSSIVPLNTMGNYSDLREPQ